jgi:inorganic triphosphatase YgiF
MAEEFELKFRVAPDMARLLIDGLGLGDPRTLDATYFDTPDQALRRSGWSLRVREEAGGRVQTAKRAAGETGVFGRTELEAAVEAAAPNLDAEGFEPVRAALGQGAVAPAFAVRVQRRKGTLVRNGAEIEAALDEGVIEAGDRREELHELELELMRGAPDALLALTRELMTAAPLDLAFESKSDRGYALLGNGAVERSSPAGDLSAGQAFRRAARDLLAAFQLHARAFIAEPEADSLHQTRVALRRLRSLFSAFRPVARDETFDLLRDALRMLASALNEARDLDVFIEVLGEAEPDEAGVEDLRRTAEARRATAYEHALAALDSDRRRRLALDVAAWLEAGPWTRDELRAALRDQPATAFAGVTLDRLRRKLKRSGAHLARLSAEERHEARIQAKKLRYAADAFAPLFPQAEKSRRRFFRALKALQEALGSLNDQAVGRGLALQVAESAGPAAAFAAGRLTAQRERGEAALVDEAEASFKILMKQKPFWRSVPAAPDIPATT